jgi:hypothetical protein
VCLGGRSPSSLDRVGVPRHPSFRPNDGPPERIRAAAEQLAQVRAALSPVIVGLLTGCLVDDLSWSKLGRRFGCDPKTAKSWTVAAVKGLAAV